MHLILIILGLSFSLSGQCQPAGSFSLFLKDFKSRHLVHSRNVYVYLPPDYNLTQLQRYPVLYMHDGQNLFDPKRAYLGQTWQALSTLNRLIKNKVIPPIIVVAVDNTADRLNEYTHDFDPHRQQGGRGNAYLQFMVQELKPLVDQSFMTLKERQHTGILGSSLGGLISVYGAARYAHTFGLVGALSPSIWWNQQSILKIVEAAELPVRVYIDMGTVGGELPEDARLLADTYQRLGMDQNLLLNIQPGAYHAEKFWAQRLPVALRFLFPR
jgi:predicted alpha/beta superfamily hydrolase